MTDAPSSPASGHGESAQSPSHDALARLSRRRPLEKQLVATLALIALAVAGNAIHLPLFFDVNVLFGSVAALLALVWLGIGSGLAVAIAGGLATWILWGQPDDLILLPLEILVVAWRRQHAEIRRGSAPPLAVSVAWYWILLGVPLIGAFHYWWLGMGWTPTLLIALKQVLNGLVNAALAELILIGVAIARGRTQQLRIADLFFSAFLMAVLVPLAGAIVWTNADLRNQLEGDLAARMRLLGQAMALSLDQTGDVTKTHWDQADLTALDPRLAEDFDPQAQVQMHLITDAGLPVNARQQAQPSSVPDLALVVPASDALSRVEQWYQGKYRLTVPIQRPAEDAQLVVTVAAAALIDHLQRIVLPLLAALLVLALGAVFVSDPIANWLSHSLGTLMVAAQALPEVIRSGIPHPVKLAKPWFELGVISESVNQIAEALGNRFSDVQAERRYLANVVAGIHAGAWEWNLSSDAIRINADWASLLGYDLGELEPITLARWKPLIHPDDLVRTMAEVEQQLLSRAPFIETEYRMRHRDGHWVWIQSRGRVMEHDDTGAPLLFSGIHLDVSQRKHTELELIESRQRFEDIADASADWLWETDQDVSYNYVSTGVGQVLGYRPAELIGRCPFEFMLAQDANELARVLADCATNGEAFRDLALKFLHRDGRVITVSATGVSIHDADGRLTGYRGVARDITERALLEARLRQLSSAVEQSPESIVITNTQGSVEYVNDAFVQSSGYSRAEILGQNPRILQSGQTPHATYQDLWRTLARGEVWRGEFINRSKDGAISIKHAIISPIRQDDGRLTNYLGVQEDVTERKRLSEELERHRQTLEDRVIERTAELTQARAEAERLAEVKGEFLANMSHEIRTPMNAVLGLAYVLMRQELPHEAQQLAHKIHESGQNLLGILNDILDVSKIEAGKIDLECAPFRLTQVLDNLATVMTSTAKEKHKTLKLIIIPPACADWALRGDVLRLGQVLINLANNAIKFTEHGVVEVRIDERRRDPDRVRLRFAVRDTGIGIDAETQARLFQPFAQADTSTTRRFGGTGLGLVIVRRLVELMGGTLGLDSLAGQGSTFWFELPFDVAQSDTLSARAPLPMQVLVVNDDPALSEGLLATIRALGWSARELQTGDEALMLVRDDPGYQGSDTVVLLAQLLGPCGLKNAKAIRESLPDSQWPLCFALSPRLIEPAKDSHGQATVDAVLAEPLSAVALYDAVVRAQHRRRGKQSTALAPASVQRLRGLRLLVVDDAETNREVARRIFADEGATVTLASDGQQALDWLIGHPDAVDAVLMDVQMPVLDGLEATRQIRQCAAIAKLPVIALTAGAMASQEAAAVDAGMDGFLGKPFDVEKTVATIQHLVNGVAEILVQPSDATDTTNDDWPGLAVGRALALWKDPALYRRHLRQFRADWSDVAAGLAIAEPQEAKSLAHALKGVSGNLGLMEVCACAQTLEQQLARADTGGSVEGAEGVDNSRTALNAALETAFDSIGRYAPEATAAPPAESDEFSDAIDAAAVRALLHELRDTFAEYDTIGAEPLLEELASHLPADQLAALRQAVDQLDASASTVALRALATQLGEPMDSESS